MTLPHSLFARLVHAVYDLLAWVCFEAHIEPLEVWSGLNGLLWGVWVGNPWMSVFSTTPGFATMAIVPEWLWGAVALAGSITQLAGRLYGRPAWQRIGARTLAALWMFTAAALAVENWRWPAIVMYPMLAAASLLVSYRSESRPKRPAHIPILPIECRIDDRQ